LTDSAQDIWIATQLKTKLLVDSEVSSINYSIETVNQVVYLMGVAQSQAEIDRVIGHAKNISYVRRVVNYVRVKDA
jgi:osmotically-inducible protein OsmY